MLCLEARSCGGEARDARWLAPESIAAFLGLEIAWRKAASSREPSRTHRGDGSRESYLGAAPDRIGTGSETRYPTFRQGPSALLARGIGTQPSTRLPALDDFRAKPRQGD